MNLSRSALRRLWLAVLIVAITNSGCTSKTKPDELTFTISGVVRSSADQTPLEAAIIQASGTNGSGVWTPRSALTDAAGHYVITGLRDSVTLTANKEGFLPATANLQLTQDTPLDFAMAKGVLDGADLVVNKTLSGSITGSEVKCDPQWDRNAPCLRFSFLADTLRVFQFVLTFDCAELELHLFHPGGARLFNISKASPITQDMLLGPGIYEVRIMAYYSCHRFDLTVK